MAFFQAAPELGNQYDDDPLLREYLARVLPPDVLSTSEDERRHLGGLAGKALYHAQLADLEHEPILTQWDAWGHRIDRIELTSLWKEAARLSAEHGLVAEAYERAHGEYSRVLMMAKNYVVQGSLDVYSCPLAMTDGAARTLCDLGDRSLIERAVPRLTSRDPNTMWTSGQWMTERTGGSDVGASETIAREVGGGWALYGTKWFTSATTADMALTLARPEGNPPGGRGLALFYVETRGEDGRLQGIAINRLKDKLGTRKVPTAELTLDGAIAVPVRGTSDGVRHIAPMLNVTRMWNAVASAWGARRCLALMKSYARRRAAFGAPLSEKPLHVDTLAGVAAEAEAVFHLAFRVVELLARSEAGVASEAEAQLLRVLTPIAKLTTAKQGVAIASEALESFGGAGYVEDTGLPRLLADAQVLPIWEGTTNVLSLDTLKALVRDGAGSALREEIAKTLARVTHPSLSPLVKVVASASASASEWLHAAAEPDALERGARRFALTTGRTLELAYLAAHASWCLDHGRGERAAAAARRFARTPIDLIDRDIGASDSRALAGGA